MAWLAVWLALFAALAPSVSHAVRAWAATPGAAQAAWIEICTSTGPRWMALPGLASASDLNAAARSGTTTTSEALAIDPARSVTTSPDSAMDSRTDGSDPASGLALAHCPFCLLMADRLAPPSASITLFFIAPGHAVRPSDPSLHTPPAHTVAAAQPRGPPAL
ncbi:DUF2946 family protein [Rhodoferax sp.]|uniref:DUF2946 family protein n=1 Tax=Rhodoferax sp. TaxID=50421 RepID=UPI00262B03E3|nr:DUF2946 family protein [Rhodoferax sp.]MDD2926310.1 DUF2946 family protein [Rhodoferax sp.]